MKQQNQLQYVELDAERMIRAGAIKRTIRPARLWVSLYRLCIAALLVVEPYLLIQTAKKDLLIQTSKKDLLIQPILFFATLSGFFIFHFLAFSCKKPAVRAMREYWEAFLRSYGPVAMGTGFRDLEILQGSGVSWRTIANTEMIYPGEYTESNSILRGQYRGISFESSELQTLCCRRGRHQWDEYVFFCGQWTVLSLNGRYQPELQIIERGFRNTKHRLSLLARYTVGHRYFPKSLSFNLRFRLYAPNRSDAAYVLTPEVMKQICRMAAQIRSKLMLCFVNGECHIAVRQAWFRPSRLHRDDFPAPWRWSFRPPSIFLPFREERFAACMQRDAAPFAALVDELLRNKNLFKQEVEL